MNNEAHLEQLKREIATRTANDRRQSVTDALKAGRIRDRRQGERRVAIDNAKAALVCARVYEAWTRNPRFPLNVGR